MPLEEDALIEKQAAAEGIPVSVWLRNAASAALPTQPKRTKASVASPPADLPDTARAASGEDAQDRAERIAEQKRCTHPKTEYNGAVRICTTCRKVVR